MSGLISNYFKKKGKESTASEPRTDLMSTSETISIFSKDTVMSKVKAFDSFPSSPKSKSSIFSSTTSLTVTNYDVATYRKRIKGVSRCELFNLYSNVFKPSPDFVFLKEKKVSEIGILCLNGLINGLGLLIQDP